LLRTFAAQKMVGHVLILPFFKTRSGLLQKT